MVGSHVYILFVCFRIFVYFLLVPLSIRFVIQPQRYYTRATGGSKESPHRAVKRIYAALFHL